MGYIFGNQCGVMTVNDERTIGQPKEIRFINSGYDLHRASGADRMGGTGSLYVSALF